MRSHRSVPRSIRRFIAGAVACWLIVSAVSVAHAQVRTAPEGNSLPEQPPPATAAPMDDHEHPPPVKLTREQHFAFASRIDTSRFRKLTVFDGGRAKIVDTLAREQLETIYGKPRWKDTWTQGGEEKSLKYDPVFTYLDLIFNKEYYVDKAIIYVEVLDLREAMLVGLGRDEQETWKVRGRLTPERIGKPEVSEAIAEREKHVLMSKAISQVRSAVMAFSRPDARLYMVSPKAGEDQWKHLFELGAKSQSVPFADAGVARDVAEQFHKLSDAWAAADAPAVNAALNALSDSIPRLNPATYPPQWKRDTEYVYNATARFTIGYVGYLLGAIALLVAFAVRRRWLISTGIGLLGVGFLVHTIGVGIRIVLAGRWPIHNQYESFIAITWLAVIAGSVLMILRRQWLYGAAAAALGAASLLFANTVDIPSKEVGQVAGILATSRILYVHVNMVLVSYGLIALGFFTSLFYLFLHYAQGRQAVAFAATGLGAVPVAVGGGNVQSGDGNGDEPLVGRQATLRDLDQAQMVILQLAFWLLGFGILLGAYWADHAWGRWWAWDPKETWALITWIVYLIVIHLRFTVKNRGLVTAWLSVVGFGVMLWTYWGVNLLLAGLHSYA